jgi:hypothetical protein
MRVRVGVLRACRVDEEEGGGGGGGRRRRREEEGGGRNSITSKNVHSGEKRVLGGRAGGRKSSSGFRI